MISVALRWHELRLVGSLSFVFFRSLLLLLMVMMHVGLLTMMKMVLLLLILIPATLQVVLLRLAAHSEGKL